MIDPVKLEEEFGGAAQKHHDYVSPRKKVPGFAL